MLFLACFSPIVEVLYEISVLFLKIVVCVKMFATTVKSESSDRYFDMI